MMRAAIEVPRTATVGPGFGCEDCGPTVISRTGAGCARRRLAVAAVLALDPQFARHHLGAAERPRPSAYTRAPAPQIGNVTFASGAFTVQRASITAGVKR